MWKQTHLRKGSRSFDKDLDCSSSVVENVDLEDVDLEGNVQEKKSAWVDDRAHETLLKYEGYLLEKYGEESSQHRELDKEVWYRASGGKKRGMLTSSIMANKTKRYVYFFKLFGSNMFKLKYSHYFFMQPLLSQ
ncbi:hypothetical protein Hanom_Chr00s000005g01611151 [Helianthus anomalus]